MLKRMTMLPGLMLAAGVAAAASQPAAAGLSVQEPKAATPQLGALLQLIDVRSYHHCHNMRRRTRCHSTQRLPVNWPPNTNTSRRSSLSERHANKADTCANGRRGWFCWR